MNWHVKDLGLYPFCPGKFYPIMPKLQEQGKDELLINPNKCLMPNHSVQDSLSLYSSEQDTHFHASFEKHTVG